MAHKGRNWPYLFPRDLSPERTPTFNWCCYAKQYKLEIYDAVGPFASWMGYNDYSEEGTYDVPTGEIIYHWNKPPGSPSTQSIEARINLKDTIDFNEIRWYLLIGTTVHKSTPTPNILGRNPQQLDNWALGDGFTHVDFVAGRLIKPKRYH